MLNALKFVRVTVLGWLAPGARSSRGLLTPRTWPRSVRSTVPPRLAGRATWDWPRLAAVSRWPRALLLYLALPFGCRHGRTTLLSCLHCRCSPRRAATAVVASSSRAPVRCISTLLSALYMSSLPHARGRATVTMPIMALQRVGHAGRTWVHVVCSAGTWAS